MSTGVDGNTQVHVYQIKKAEKGETFKKKLTWMLRELKIVDGKDKAKVGISVFFLEINICE